MRAGSGSPSRWRTATSPGTSRGSGDQVAVLDEELPRSLVVLGRLCVVVSGRGLDGAASEQLDSAAVVGRPHAPQSPMQQFQRLLVRRQGMGALGGDRRSV